MDKDNLIIFFIIICVLSLVFFILIKDNRKQINEKYKPSSKGFNNLNIKENYNTLINYWSDIVSGDRNLQNGQKFDSFSVYNPKLLRYELDHLKIAVIVRGHQAWKQNNEEVLTAAQTCYMFLANFLEDIPEDFESEPQKFNELIMSFSDAKNKNEEEDILKKLASSDMDKITEANNMLTQRQLEFSKHFRASIEKFINKNQT